MNPVEKLHALGQSLWYDNIQRRLLENGELQAMIARGEVRGLTSNPSIFHNAIAKSHDYDSALIPLAWAGWSAEQIFWELVIEDIRQACHLLHPIYEESNGEDGYVSIEVSPFLAHDTHATLAQAQELWARLAQPNLMVKIPATRAGLPAIRGAIAAGLNINVTLIFSLSRYLEVMEAYRRGLEERLAAGRPIHHIASVASFFVSRLDTKVDARLPEGSPLRGRAAIANAKLAYQEFLHFFQGERWERLRSQGARLQRPLWASTSTKNPAYPDTLYVDGLIGPHTVNTVPPSTLQAFREHGKADLTLTREVEQAREILAALEQQGISMAEVAQELEDEGVKAFADSMRALLQTLEERRQEAASSLGPLADSVSARMARLEAERVPARLWEHDPGLWSEAPSAQAEIRARLGWLDSPSQARQRLASYRDLVEEVRNQGLERILVIGMGGSSLTAEVLSCLFASPRALPDGAPRLAILDSTHPQQVLQAARDFPPGRSLYILASKSGATAEVMAAFDYFWELNRADGARFVAITDPGSPLEQMARRRGFRRVFLADETVGGRYSALTDFGLLPAALLGADLGRLLERAEWMRRQCARDVPAARNPGLALGVVMAEAALQGRDKLTILADAPLAPLAPWIEQLVAESSGKDGKGIVPIALEPLDAPEVYGGDRLFVYLRQNGELDSGLAALRAAGHPVIEFSIADSYEVGGEFYRWEIATAVACHILGVNAFDQPDVQESKQRTQARIAAYRAGRGWLQEEAGIGIEQAERLFAFLGQARAGDYVALNAYLPRTAEIEAHLQRLRVAIRERTRCAVTAGFGPRFQHSTGQLHKGGTNSGLFVQILDQSEEDLPIPHQGLTFGMLLRAQALGDYETLLARQRRAMRVLLRTPAELELLVEATQSWASYTS